MRLVIVTGVSGAGKSTAMKALEDLGYYCADNLPLPLVPKFAELLDGRPEIDRVALVIDARAGEFLQDAQSVFAGLRAAGQTIEVFFIDAPDEVLIRRFSETRRRHPLSGTDLRAGILMERARIAALRDEATTVIDTGALTVHQLRTLVQDRYGRRDSELQVTVVSFGFKFGLPSEADVVLDVRFFPNPFFVEGLAHLTGEDDAVVRYVMENLDVRTFVEKAEELLTIAIHGFQKEGKSYATVAIGCTGGRHRSVAIARELGHRLGRHFRVGVRHRDLGKAPETTG